MNCLPLSYDLAIILVGKNTEKTQVNLLGNIGRKTVLKRQKTRLTTKRKTCLPKHKKQ